MSLAQLFPALLGISTSFTLSGMYFGSSQLTLPILYRLPSSTSTDFFAEFFHRGVSPAVSFAIVSTLSSAVAAFLDPDKRVGYVLAATATIATMPWTRGVMMGTNKRLVGLSEDEKIREKAGGEEVVALLKRWKWMNMVRAGMAFVGGGYGLWTLAHGF